MAAWAAPATRPARAARAPPATRAAGAASDVSDGFVVYLKSWLSKEREKE